MNKSNLVAVVAAKAGMTKKDAERAIEATFATITECISGEDKVQISGFGTFETRKREAYLGRNPRTNEAVQVPAARIPAFIPSKKLKDHLR